MIEFKVVIYLSRIARLAGQSKAYSRMASMRGQVKPAHRTLAMPSARRFKDNFARENPLE
jgi:hypothetical protein